MSDFSRTDPKVNRRSFVKLGALAATPVVALAPAAALAADDSAVRLVRIEDEQAIRQLARDWLRGFNASFAERSTSTLGWSASARWGRDIARLDAADLEGVAIDFDGSDRAVFALPVAIERVVAHTGDSTLEKMARFQGVTRSSTTERATLRFTLVKHPDRWLHPAIDLVR